MTSAARLRYLKDLKRDADPMSERSIDRTSRYDRSRRIRDAVEGALSDIIFLGTRSGYGGGGAGFGGRFSHEEETEHHDP
jgi:hypothetical protein